VSRKYPKLISTWTLAYLTDITDLCHCFFRKIFSNSVTVRRPRTDAARSEKHTFQEHNNAQTPAPNSSSSSRGPLKLPFSECPASFKGVKRSESELDNLPSSSAKVKNEWSYTSTAPLCPHGLDRHHDISDLYTN